MRPEGSALSLPTGWTKLPFGSFLKESRIVGGTGASASKLSVRLYGRGVRKNTKGSLGSENTRYFVRTKGQLIFSKLDFLNGAFGIVPDHLDGLESTLDLPAFDVSPEVDTRWLIAYLTRDEFYRSFLGVSKGGRKARRVSPEEFLRATLSVPPLFEQRRIADILSTVDEAIQAMQAVVEQTRIVRQGVLQRLMTKGIGHTQFKQTDIGDTPATWEVRPLGELCVLTNGNGFRPPDWSDAGLPIIRIQNLNGSRQFNFFSGQPNVKWIISPGDLLFSWAGVRGVSFGPHLWSGPLGVLNQHIFKVSTKIDVEKKWLFYAMKLVTGRIEAKAHGFKDSLVHVHKSEITGQLVGVPSLSEQNNIVARLEALDEAEHIAKQELTAATTLKSALMSDLLSGRVRVTTELLEAAE